MKRTPLFDEKHQEKHIGDLKFSKKIENLVEVEKYFIDECTRRRLFWAFDVSAIEPLYFDTINYTTYAGCFMMHPLQPEMAQRQMYDALRDSTSKVDFVSHFKDKIKNKSANKYIKENKKIKGKYDAVVVLPGNNKIFVNVCIKKLQWIVDQHGDKVLFKPHPLTGQDTLDKMREKINRKETTFAPIDSDLYEVLPAVNTVYTSHISESAMYATAIGKTISPIDRFEKRQPSSFGHINYFLFNELNPIESINPMLSSYKSGIVCPELEPNWKEKVTSYLDYILEIREKVKDHFIQGE
jgi:hypothetical protein